MKTLSDNLYDSIMESLQEGDSLMENEKYNDALSCYKKALDQVPNEKIDWEISLHIYTALGDCYFNLEDYESASHNYNLALQCPEGTVNGYVWFGYGQSLYELDNKDKAKDALMSAYMLEGEEIFEDSDEIYFELIKPFISK